MSRYIDIFKIFMEYPEQSPKNLAEVEDLEKKCREAGKTELAEYLLNWRVDMLYRLEMEWTESDAKAG